MSDKLRTVLTGGYDKTDVLRYVDMILIRTMMLEQGAKKEELPALPPPQFRTVKLGGFNKDDVNEYIRSELEKLN